MKWADGPHGIKIIDNFLPESYSAEILNHVDSGNQEWYLQKNITHTNDPAPSPLNYGFNFHVWRFNTGLSDAALSRFLLPALLTIRDTVGATKILRARLDMTVASGVRWIYDAHIDIHDEPNITTIYYINDSDGETLIYNERKKSDKYTVKRAIEPKRNRLVIFDGALYHTGHSPIEHSNRILLNSNYI